MKSNLFLLIILFVSCNDNVKTNYKLVKVDSSERGNKIATKYFVDSNNYRKKINIYFWDNGKVMTKAFFFDNLKDGDWQFFSITGKLKSVLKFKRNKLIKRIEYDTLRNIITND